MKSEFYQKVAYIGLRNDDGSYMLNVPLYVKVAELNKNGMTDMQEELIHRISSIMLKHYEREISGFFARKSNKGEKRNENFI
jgi:hypothetical protein